jgi:hypothetical protein
VWHQENLCPTPLTGEPLSGDSLSARELGQLRPFIAVFPRECMGQLAFLATARVYLHQGPGGLRGEGAAFHGGGVALRGGGPKARPAAPAPPPGPPVPPPPPPPGNCTLQQNVGGFGGDQRRQLVRRDEGCCAVCVKDEWRSSTAIRPATSSRRSQGRPKAGYAKPGSWACRVRPKPPQ